MSPKRVDSLAVALPATVLASTFLLGCAAHDPSGTETVASSTKPEPAAASPDTADRQLARLERVERLEAGASDDRRAWELRESLDASWEQGQAHWLAGEAELAQDSFDAGLETVLAAGLDLDAHPDLRRRVDDILAGVHRLAVEEALREDAEAPQLPELDEVADDAAPAVRVADHSHAPARPGLPAWLAAATGDYTIPMEDHPSVDAMVRFYVEKRKRHLETGLRRLGQYGPTIAKIFEEEGVPADLMWLSIVESNANPHAYSRARAKGLWQFIPSTGKRYGLQQDFWVDERADFEKATRSSARYMKYLHGLFDDWHLALAAYNAGEGKVGRGIRRTGRPDYWHLRRTRNLRPETKSYVPAMLAVMRIVRDPAAHGIELAPAEPLAWEVARVDGCADLSVLADCAGTDVETLKVLNPELRRGCTPGDAENYALRVPAGRSRTFAERFAQLPPEKRLNWARHRVASGESLSVIARRYGSSVSGIMAANKLSSANRIGVGWNLLIPRGDAAAALPGASASTPSSRATATRTQSYRVRPGDTMAAIAKRHGTSVASLARMNGIRNADRIRPGQRLMITGAAPASGGSGSGSASYTVRRGDTLIGIARTHGVSVAQLREWNRLPARGYIHPGQRLVVRGGKTYSVRRGDTLSAIARRFRTTVSELRQWNDLNRSGLIHPGDRLTIFSN